MILEEIRIENLFSYYGSHSFPLSPPADGRNVVLISGRNGYGKTSFLNSLKLFFAGATREIMTVQAGREMRNKKDYLLGYGDEWIGALNRHAKSEDKKRFGISVIWQEERAASARHATGRSKRTAYTKCCKSRQSSVSHWKITMVISPAMRAPSLKNACRNPFCLFSSTTASRSSNWPKPIERGNFAK